MQWNFVNCFILFFFFIFVQNISFKYSKFFNAAEEVSNFVSVRCLNGYNACWKIQMDLFISKSDLSSLSELQKIRKFEEKEQIAKLQQRCRKSAKGSSTKGNRRSTAFNRSALRTKR